MIQSEGEDLYLEYERLKEENKLLKQQVSRYKEGMEPGIHNPRGAGRKPQNGEWFARYDAVMGSIIEGMSWKDAVEQLGISRSAYFRYRKICISDMVKGRTQVQKEGKKRNGKKPVDGNTMA